MSESDTKRNAEISIAVRAVEAAADTLLKTVATLADDTTGRSSVPSFTTDIAEAFWAFDLQHARIKNELAAFEKLAYVALKQRVCSLAVLRYDHSVDEVDTHVIGAFRIGEKPFGAFPHMDILLGVIRDKRWNDLPATLAASVPDSNGVALTRAVRKYLRAFVQYRIDPTIDHREDVCMAAQASILASIDAIDFVDSRAVRVDYLREFYVLLAR